MFVRYYRFVEMSEEDLDKETIGRKVSERSKSFQTRKLFFQLAESLPFELLEEYRQIFRLFDQDGQGRISWSDLGRQSSTLIKTSWLCILQKPWWGWTLGVLWIFGEGHASGIWQLEKDKDFLAQ